MNIDGLCFAVSSKRIYKMTVLAELRKLVESGRIRLGDAIGQILPEVRGKISDQRILWLVNEMNGYPNPLDWYQRPSEEYPPYRIVVGELKTVDKNGNLGPVTHPFATKERYFLAASVSWLEESASIESHRALVEMPELGTYLAKSTGGGGVVCECSREQISRILISVKNTIVDLINEVTSQKVTRTRSKTDLEPPASTKTGAKALRQEEKHRAGVTASFEPAPTEPGKEVKNAHLQQPLGTDQLSTDCIDRNAISAVVAVELNRAAVDAIYHSFTNPETSFISHGAFLFFLLNEANRYQRDPKALSVVRFNLWLEPPKPEVTIMPIPNHLVREVGTRIFQRMRRLDWLAHYDQEFAILLPLTTRVEALAIVKSIIDSIYASPLAPNLLSKQLGVSFGIASMPEDCSHPGILLAAAEEAKRRAEKSAVSIACFSDS